MRQVSFTVERGEWVALLGANGSGKSTIARLANGLLLPNDGEVIVEGISSWKHDKLADIRKLVGLVTQDPDNQIVSTTVFDEVAFGPQNLGWEPERIYEVVSEVLAHVGLPEEVFAKRDPNTMSGGEKQRVVIAAILAMEPHYLVLDEPTAMLDPVSRAHVLESIHTAAKNGHGVVHITHVLKEASFAHRVLVLEEGSIVYDGAPKGILDDTEALTRYGLLAEPAVRGPLEPVASTASASGTASRHDEDLPTGSRNASFQSMESAGVSPHDTTPSDAARSHEGSASEAAHTQGGSVSVATLPPTLELNDVSFTYSNSPDTPPVLEGCSFKLHAGECKLLVGASGSGKSTILSLAAGLYKPSKGEVTLSGTKPPTAGEVGLVFQQPESQLFAQTVQDDILFGPKNLGFPPDQRGDYLVDSVLDAVGLEPEKFKKRSPYSLSGGEARRVAIATTLALQTDFLLLDEPTAGLDARGKVFIYELLQRLMAEGKGVIVATHDPGYFMDLATSRLEL